MRVHELPDFMTVEETAQLLRIGRTTAYAEVRRFHVTHGREGIPSVRIGRSLRIPRSALLHLIAATTDRAAGEHAHDAA